MRLSPRHYSGLQHIDYAWLAAGFPRKRGKFYRLFCRASGSAQGLLARKNDRKILIVSHQDAPILLRYTLFNMPSAARWHVTTGH